MNYKGIIFDFNGTLFWDSDKHTIAWKAMARKLRNEELTDDEMDKKIQGRPNPAIIEYLSGRKPNDSEIYELSMEKERIYRQLCHDDPNSCHLAPGAVDLLEFLVENRIPHTIATSSESTNLAFYIESFNLSRWFELDLIIHDNGSIPGKPAPDIYLKAAGRIGLKPKECIVVEDSLAGIRSAHRAGIGHIVAIGPEEKRGELEAIEEVDLVIGHFAEIGRDLFSR